MTPTRSIFAGLSTWEIVVWYCLVVVSTANGLKFPEFKIAYHTRSLPDVTPRYANPPLELPNDYDAVRKAVDQVTRGRARHASLA